MSMSLQRTGDILHVTLGGELHVASAAQLHSALAAELPGLQAALIDTSEVVRVDTSIAQLLFWFSTRVPTLQFRATSRAWASAWRQLGLDQPLDSERDRGAQWQRPS